MTLKEKINYMLSQYSMTKDNPTVLRELKRLAALTAQVIEWVENNDPTDFSDQLAEVNARMDEIDGIVNSLNLGTINSDIAALKTAVAQAQENANAAKATAESAETASAKAISDVAELNTTVNEFKESVNESIRTLTASVSAADAKADEAASKADDAVSASEEANTSAEAASTKADTANTTASQAKTTADIAKTAVDKAATDIQEMQFALDGKQDALTFDSAPTAGSDNPVTSDGIYKAIRAGGGTVVLDDTVTENSKNGVKSSGIYTAIETAKTTLDQRITNVDTKVDAHTDDIAALQEFQQTQDTTNETHNTQIASNASAISALQTGKQDRLKKVVGETTQYAQTTLANSVPDSVSPTDPVTIPTTEAVSDALSHKQGTLTFDSAPTNGSENPVTSGGVFTALGAKQNTLTFDSTPTEGSDNPVTSDGIYKAIQASDGGTIVLDNTVTKDSQNGVKSSGIYTAVKAVQDDLDGQKSLISANTDAISTAEDKITTLKENSETVVAELSTLSGEVASLEADKMNKMEVDERPTANSTNLVKSGGVYRYAEEIRNTANLALDAVDTKQDALKFDTTPKYGSTNPVTSGGLYTKFNAMKSNINEKQEQLYTTNGSDTIHRNINTYVLPELTSEPDQSLHQMATAYAVWNAIQTASGGGGGTPSVISVTWELVGTDRYRAIGTIPKTFTALFMVLCGRVDIYDVSFMIPIVQTASATSYANMGSYICNHPSRSVDLLMPVSDTMKVAYNKNFAHPLNIKYSSLTYARFLNNSMVSGSEGQIAFNRNSYVFGISS